MPSFRVTGLGRWRRFNNVETGGIEGGSREYGDIFCARVFSIRRKKAVAVHRFCSLVLRKIVWTWLRGTELLLQRSFLSLSFFLSENALEHSSTLLLTASPSRNGRGKKKLRFFRYWGQNDFQFLKSAWRVARCRTSPEHGQRSDSDILV